MSQKVVIKLLGVDVMEVAAPPGVEVEIQQYRKEDQPQDAPRYQETGWPGLLFTYSWPLSKAKRQKKKKGAS